MLSFDAAEIVRATGGRIIAGDPLTRAWSCVIDSRDATPGSLFIAFSGEQSDGHRYLQAAARAGATIALVTETPAEAGDLCLILVDDARAALQDLARYQRSRLTIPVIGVTGSTGKTSTKEMLRAALGSALNVVATQANHNNELGVPLTVLAADASTGALVVEMGMRAQGEIALLADIARPQIGVITTIGDAHLERLGSRENIARAKAELFEALPEDGLAVVAAGVAFEPLLRASSKAPLRTVGRDGVRANIRASQLRLDRQACPHARVTMPDGREILLDLSVPGVHNVDNALLVLAVGDWLGLDPEAMCAALASVAPTGMRLNSFEISARGLTVIADTYNANPDSMAAALRTLAALQPGEPGKTGGSGVGRRVVVLGDMLELGDASLEAHRAVLELADELGLGYLFVFGSQFCAVAMPGVAYDDMDVLTRAVSSFVRSGDLILVKGSRGMRMERVIDALQEQD